MAVTTKRQEIGCCMVRSRIKFGGLTTPLFSPVAGKEEIKTNVSSGSLPRLSSRMRHFSIHLVPYWKSCFAWRAGYCLGLSAARGYAWCASAVFRNPGAGELMHEILPEAV